MAAPSSNTAPLGTADSPSASQAMPCAELFDQHATTIARLIERLVGRGAHVDDLLQEVFLSAHRKQDSIPTSEESLKWLRAIALNHVRHHRRSHARRLRLASALEKQPSRTTLVADEHSSRLQRATQVRAVISDLPWKQREVFVLFELEEVDGEEIASLLGIPKATVWTRLHHGRKRFRKLWQARHPEEVSS